MLTDSIDFRRDQVRLRHEKDPTRTWFSHEWDWLHSEMYLSPFALTELDDLVLTFRKTLALLGLMDYPSRDDIERNRGFAFASGDAKDLQKNANIFEEEHWNEEEEDIEEEDSDEENPSEGKDEFDFIEILESMGGIDGFLMFSNMGEQTSISSSYNVTLSRPMVQHKADEQWRNEKEWRNIPPSKQYDWYCQIIHDWEGMNEANIPHDHPFKYIHYYNAEGKMLKRCFGVYIALAYGLSSEMFRLSSNHIGQHHDKICAEFSSQACSIHFKMDKLLASKVVTLKTAAEDIQRVLDIDCKKDILAMQSRYYVELNPLTDHKILKLRYNFPPLQPSNGLLIETEHLYQLPVKKAPEHAPVGWPGNHDKY